MAPDGAGIRSSNTGWLYTNRWRWLDLPTKRQYDAHQSSVSLLHRLQLYSCFFLDYKPRETRTANLDTSNRLTTTTMQSIRSVGGFLFAFSA